MPPTDYGITPARLQMIAEVRGRVMFEDGSDHARAFLVRRCALGRRSGRGLRGPGSGSEPASRSNDDRMALCRADDRSLSQRAGARLRRRRAYRVPAASGFADHEAPNFPVNTATKRILR